MNLRSRTASTGIDLVARIGYPSAQRAAGNGDRVRIAVISSAVGENRLDLNAQEPLSALHHEVVGQTVAVRLRNCDAERGGFEKEGQFGQFRSEERRVGKEE